MINTHSAHTIRPRITADIAGVLLQDMEDVVVLQKGHRPGPHKRDRSDQWTPTFFARVIMAIRLALKLVKLCQWLFYPASIADLQGAFVEFGFTPLNHFLA